MSSRKNFFIKAENFSHSGSALIKGVNDNTGNLSKKTRGFLQSFFSGGRSFLVGIVLFVLFLVVVLYFL